MSNLLASTWVTFVQAILAIAGTWLLAFGLKSVRESGGFDTSNPQPLSHRFWFGLLFITLSLVPPLVSPFITPQDQIQTHSTNPSVPNIEEESNADN